MHPTIERLQVFNEPDLSDNTATYDGSISDEVLHMELTETEFAEALGMRKSDLFVKRMFSCMARDGDSITFHSFLEILRRFAKGLFEPNRFTCTVSLQQT